MPLRRIPVVRLQELTPQGQFWQCRALRGLSLGSLGPLLRLLGPHSDLCIVTDNTNKIIILVVRT